MKKLILFTLSLLILERSFASQSSYLILRAIVPTVYSVKSVGRGPAGEPVLQVFSNDSSHALGPKVTIEDSIHAGHQRISIIHP